MLHPNVKKLAAIIRDGHKNNELSNGASLSHWKNENEKVIQRYLQYREESTIQHSHLIQFDIVDDLLLMCYSSKAHNEIMRSGWTQPLKDIRGVVYNIGGSEPVLLSRGFPKFFNWKELSSEEHARFLDEEMLFFEKKDGHLIEAFLHNGDVKTTTRGKLNTASAQIAQEMFTKNDWNLLASEFPGLMTVLFELIGPDARVLVDYPENVLVVIGMYDHNGEEISFDPHKLRDLNFKVPDVFRSTPRKVLEMLDDSGAQGEGFVALSSDGTRIKFKFKRYIGKMVEEKLSHKYIIQRMISGNLSQMLETLPEEISQETKHVLADVRHCLDSGTYISLYSLHNCRDGSKEYFRKVVRDFWKIFSQDRDKYRSILDSEILKFTAFTSSSDQRNLEVSRSEKSTDHIRKNKILPPLLPFSA